MTTRPTPPPPPLPAAPAPSTAPSPPPAHLRTRRIITVPPQPSPSHAHPAPDHQRSHAHALQPSPSPSHVHPAPDHERSHAHAIQPSPSPSQAHAAPHHERSHAHAEPDDQRSQSAHDPARSSRPLPLLDADDLGWVAELTDAVADLAGEPWRVALDMIEAGTWQRAADGEPRRPSPRRLDAATSALRRLLTGSPRDANLARNARLLLLGVPALDDATRAARIAAVAATLEITPAELDRILLADVPRERPIELTRGRPTATEVAALANVGLLQRALARAHSLQLVVRGDASPLLRGCAARGLIVAASQRDAGRETILDITGPLALCHSTAVYGRALGSLVPLLATCETFALTIRAEARGQSYEQRAEARAQSYELRAEARGQLYELRVEAPALLPAAVPRSWTLIERLATDLERAGGPLGLRVRRAPPALAQPTAEVSALACPDLGITLGERVVWIEIVGFWTPEYLSRKLARYRAAGAHEVILCVDATRACEDDDPPPGACVMRFARRVHAEPLLQLLGITAGS